MPGFEGKYEFDSLFIVFRPSTYVELSILVLLIAMVNPIRNAGFDTVRHDWAIRKHFLSARGNI